MRFLGGYGPSVDRRGGIYPARGRLRRRGVRRGEGTPPYGRPGGCACPVWPETPNLFVGAGFIPPGVFVPPQGSPGAQCVPLHGVHGGVGFAVNRGVFPQPVGAGFIPPGVFVPPQGSPSAQCAPLQGVRGGVGFAVGRGGGSSARRGGFHIRPRNLAPPQSPRDDLRPKSRTCGLWPPKRACGRSASIVPYRGLRYRRKCGSPVGTDLPLIVGAGFIPPAGVCDAAGSGGVRAPRPTAARVAALVRFG